MTRLRGRGTQIGHSVKVNSIGGWQDEITMVSVASRVSRSAKLQDTKLHEGWVEHYSFTSRVTTDVMYDSCYMCCSVCVCVDILLEFTCFCSSRIKL